MQHCRVVWRLDGYAATAQNRLRARGHSCFPQRADRVLSTGFSILWLLGATFLMVMGCCASDFKEVTDARGNVLSSNEGQAIANRLEHI